MFKRVLDCWSSKALLLQYARVWNSHCGDMTVVQQQGLLNLWVNGSSHLSFDMVQILRASMYSNKDMPCCSMFKRVFDSRSSHDSCRLWLTTLKYTCGTNCGMHGTKCGTCMEQKVPYMVQNVAHVWYSEFFTMAHVRYKMWDHM